MEKGFNLEKGLIVMVDLGDREGNLQSKLRPSIVFSNKKACEVSPVITVIPLSSQMKALHLPTHVVLKSIATTLKYDSVVLGEQITTINRNQILYPVGKLNNYLMTKVETAVSIALGTDTKKDKFDYNFIHKKIDDINTLINLFRLSASSELATVIRNQIEEIIEYCTKYDVDHKIYTSQYNLKTKDNLRKVV